MEGSNCGGEGGWTRVAYINMTESDATCPQGLTQKQLAGLSHPLCGNNITDGCDGTTFFTFDINYQQVCGQLRGYQFGFVTAFDNFFSSSIQSIEDNYVTGASITFGSNGFRRHIWTYTGGRNAIGTTTIGCPCNDGSTTQTPPFVVNDYYCESGTGSSMITTVLYNDALWDGEQCTNLEDPCCANPDLPWFKKKLNQTSNENIELRLCHNSGIQEIPLEIIELFIR